MKPPTARMPGYPAWSHPTGVRGLKRKVRKGSTYSVLSHPTGVRGLKLCSSALLGKVGVAPHGGAWIETLKMCINKRHIRVAPHGGAWIET